MPTMIGSSSSANDRIHPRTDTAPSTPADRVDAAADPALRLALVHRDAGLSQRTCDRGAVQEVAGPHPQPPLRDDVQREPRRVLVELPDQRVDLAGVERRSGQGVEGGHDPGVHGVGRVLGAELLGQLADVPGADVPRSRRPGYDERQIGGADPVGQQADLRVAEDAARTCCGRPGRCCSPRRPPALVRGRAPARRPLPPMDPWPPSAAEPPSPRPRRPWPRRPCVARRSSPSQQPTRGAPPARRSPRCAATTPGSPLPSGAPARPPPTYPGRPHLPAPRRPPTWLRGAPPARHRRGRRSRPRNRWRSWSPCDRT